MQNVGKFAQSRFTVFYPQLQVDRPKLKTQNISQVENFRNEYIVAAFKAVIYEVQPLEQRNIFIFCSARWVGCSVQRNLKLYI